MRGTAALTALVGLVSLTSIGSAHELCEGFVPENDLNISVEMQTLLGGGTTEREFHSVLDRLEKIYAPAVSRIGGRLEIVRRWSDGTVNAFATRIGSTYRITMYGGLARHKEMNADGFALVACHELGHHFGGAPKLSSPNSWWVSNEGQSDYFAGLRCLRILWPARENARFVANNRIDEFLARTCKRVWTRADEQNLCMRIGSAGKTTSFMFRLLNGEKTKARFDTPDPNRVSSTYDSHPAAQCRLDTYFQAGLCVHNTREPLSNRDVRVGTCTESAGHRFGNRPRCWYGERY